MSWQRDWRRLRERHRWQPIGGLAVLALVCGLVVDTLWTDYAAVAERHERLDAELSIARMRAARLPEMEARAKQTQTEFGGIQSRLIAAQSDGSAGDKFGQALRGWYEAKGVTQVSVRGVHRREAEGLVYYRADIDAALRIEQLVDLLQGRTYAPQAVRLVEATVNANDDSAPTGLRTLMTWEGVMAPVADDAASDKAADGTKKPPRPAVRVANENPAALKTIEEKRK
jgi:hypothetical protein